MDAMAMWVRGGPQDRVAFVDRRAPEARAALQARRAKSDLPALEVRAEHRVRLGPRVRVDVLESPDHSAPLGRRVALGFLG